MREDTFHPVDVRRDERARLVEAHWSPTCLRHDAARPQARRSPAAKQRAQDVLRWGRDWGLAPRLGERLIREAIQFFDDRRQLHRTDGPAAIERDELHWYLGGRRHRSDGPALITAAGERQWFDEGRRHRIGGPAWIHADGGMSWWQDGRVHRIGGPALIDAAIAGDDPRVREAWYQAGQLHRTDGPAVIYGDGAHEWWLEGVRVSRLDLPSAAAGAPRGSLADALFG